MASVQMVLSQGKYFIWTQKICCLLIDSQQKKPQAPKVQDHKEENPFKEDLKAQAKNSKVEIGQVEIFIKSGWKIFLIYLSSTCREDLCSRAQISS